MALQTSGAISLADIQTEFGGSNPISLSEYYSAGAGIPASGAIDFADFYGASAEQSFTLAGTTGAAFNITGLKNVPDQINWTDNYTYAQGVGGSHTQPSITLDQIRSIWDIPSITLATLAADGTPFPSTNLSHTVVFYSNGTFELICRVNLDPAETWDPENFSYDTNTKFALNPNFEGVEISFGPTSALGTTLTYTAAQLNNGFYANSSYNPPPSLYAFELGSGLVVNTDIQAFYNTVAAGPFLTSILKGNAWVSVKYLHGGI